MGRPIVGCCCPQHEDLVQRYSNFGLRLRKVGKSSRGPIRTSVLEFLHIKRRTGYICTVCLEHARGRLPQLAKHEPARQPVASPDVTETGTEADAETKEAGETSAEKTTLLDEESSSADAEPSVSEPAPMEEEESPRPGGDCGSTVEFGTTSGDAICDELDTSTAFNVVIKALRSGTTSAEDLTTCVRLWVRR